MVEILPLRTRVKYPLLLKLVVLFIFFLPLVSIQLPSAVFGFSINFARLFILLATIVLCMNIALGAKYLQASKQVVYNNPYVRWLFYYFIFSLFYYYVSLFLGHTERFGSSDLFSRNWQGRPLAQLLTFFTYGIIPFYLIKKYAQQSLYRRAIEQTIVFVILLIVYYGFFQQVSFYLGLPVTGLTLYDGRTAGAKVAGIGLLRFYSLAGEPRQAGTFLIGALLFYLYDRYGKKSFFTTVNVTLISVAFLLTLSTSAYLVAFISLMVIICDVIVRKRVNLRLRYLKYGIGLIFIFLFFFHTRLSTIVAERPIRYYHAIVSKIQGTSKSSFLLTAQSLDFVILPYLQQITKESPLHLLIGYGYGNFLTPTAHILKEYFNHDIIREGGFGDTDSYLIKIFIEGGLVALFIYFMIFFYTLRLNNKLLYFYRQHQKRKEYTKALLLRLSFITFFVGNAIHISFFYFIIMGLIIGILNNVVQEQKELAIRHNELPAGI